MESKDKATMSKAIVLEMIHDYLKLYSGISLGQWSLTFFFLLLLFFFFAMDPFDSLVKPTDPFSEN
jgi:hypothetical protein